MFKKILSYINQKRIGLASRLIKKFLITSDEIINKDLKNSKVIFKELDSQLTIKPTEQKEVNSYYSKWIGTHKVEGQFLLLLEKAYLVSQWSIPITKDGKVLLETSGRFSQLIGNLVSRTENVWLAEYKLILFLLKLKIFNFFNLDDNSKKKINSPLFHMVPRHGFNYFQGPTFSHWIFENLPQVRMYYKSLKLEPNIKLFIGKIKKDWQLLTLNLLGIENNQIHEIQQSFITKVDKLYISKLPFIHSSEIKFDPNGRSWVNKTIRSTLSKNNYIETKFKNKELIKIAFSRKYCARRRLLNEDKYLNLLSNKGYKIVYPEKISEIEKISHSYFAKVILGLPSGSAIANFIYSNRPSLIEIQDKKSLIPVWFLLSQELEMKYSLYFAEFAQNNFDFRENDLFLNDKNFPKNL